MSPPPYLPPLREGAAGRWFITAHAARRFARHALGWRGTDDDVLPEMLYRRALTELVRESERAHFVHRRPSKVGRAEADLWRGPKPRRLRYVVAAAVAPGDALPTLLTVLPTCDRRPMGEPPKRGGLRSTP